MSVWNKVFLGVIFAATIAITVLTAVEFHIRGTGLKRIANLEQRIEDTDAKIAQLRSGINHLRTSVDLRPSADKSFTEMSINELRGLVRERYIERGRAWFGCIVAQVEVRPHPPALERVEAQIILTGPLVPNATGAMTDVAPPDALRGIVYIFEERNDGNDGNDVGAAAFLGRFAVRGEPARTMFHDDEGNEINGWRVTLRTRDPLTDAEHERILNADRSRWSIYLAPPIDRIAGVFCQLTEEEMAMIPAELLERFQPRPMPELAEEDKVGETAGALAMLERYRAMMDDPEHELANDFATMLDWLYRRRSDAIRDKERIEYDIASHELALARTNAEIETMENEEIPLQEVRVETMETQRLAVIAVLEQYEAEIARIELEIEHLQTLLRTLLASIAEAQIRAAERIEEQIRNAAQPLEGVR